MVPAARFRAYFRVVSARFSVCWTQLPLAQSRHSQLARPFTSPPSPPCCGTTTSAADRHGSRGSPTARPASWSSHVGQYHAKVRPPPMMRKEACGSSAAAACMTSTAAASYRCSSAAASQWRAMRTVETRRRSRPAPIPSCQITAARVIPLCLAVPSTLRQRGQPCRRYVR